MICLLLELHDIAPTPVDYELLDEPTSQLLCRELSNSLTSPDGRLAAALLHAKMGQSWSNITDMVGRCELSTQ